MLDIDANATTAILPEVLEAMLPWLRDNHANPSGSYATARKAREAIDVAREQVADLIEASPDEIVFTGSGTESVNTALHSLDVLAGEGNAVISAIEHSAVMKFVSKQGRTVSMVKVGETGEVDMVSYRGALEEAAFVSVMMANNESGVIQPIEALLASAKDLGLPFHTDAIQAIGKIPVSVREVPVDMLSISGHKFHAPKGIGALYIRDGFSFSPLLHGGGQQKGRRSGTENTASIVAMGKAAQLAKAAVAAGSENELSEIRDTFEGLVLAGLRGCVINGCGGNRLPNTTHLSFEGCDSAGLLILLDEAGMACSAGSACMTGKSKPSHVQIAMGIPEARAKTSLRFSFSRLNTRADACIAADKVIAAVNKLRSVQGGGVGPVAIYTT